MIRSNNNDDDDDGADMGDILQGEYDHEHGELDTDDDVDVRSSLLGRRAGDAAGDSVMTSSAAAAAAQQEIHHRHSGRRQHGLGQQQQQQQQRHRRQNHSGSHHGHRKSGKRQKQRRRSGGGGGGGAATSTDGTVVVGMGRSPEPGESDGESRSRSCSDSSEDEAVDMLLERFDVLMKRVGQLSPGRIEAFHERAQPKLRALAHHDSFHDAPNMEDGPLSLRSLARETWERVAWLSALLLLQSFSSFILESYAQLIESHLVVTFFLTMLVGAGGNAGNQSAVMVIRGLATGTVHHSNQIRILWRQLVTGLIMSVILVGFGYARVVIFGGDTLSAGAICVSLFLIVVTSVVLGTLMPLGLYYIGLDPAHAGPTIQVVMDILGVFITCFVCTEMFRSSDHAAALAAAQAHHPKGHVAPHSGGAHVHSGSLHHHLAEAAASASADAASAVGTAVKHVGNHVVKLIHANLTAAAHP